MCTASRYSIVSPARAQVRAHSASRCAGGGPPRRGRLAICGDRDLTVRPPSRRCVAASATTALHNHNHNHSARARIAITACPSWTRPRLPARGGRNGFVKAWNMADGREQTLEGHTGAVFCVAQGGPHLFSAGEDAGVKTWKFGQSGQLEPVVELQGHRAPIQALSVAADSLLSADRNGEVKAWDLDTGGCKLTLKTDHLSMVMAMWVEESWGAPCIFTAALDGHCKVWDAAGSLLHDQHVTNQARTHARSPIPRTCLAAQPR